MALSDIQYKIKQVDDVCVVIIEETRIDSFKAPSFKTEMLRLIGDGWKYILINLSAVDVIDSSGLGALTFGKRQLDEIGGTLAVCCSRDKVLTLFRISKLDKYFDIYNTEEEGILQIRE